METGLSLLGFGLPAGTPSLGNILGNAVNPANLEHRWWMWFPAVAIMFVMMMSINFLGQAVTRAADPKQRAI
jgi:peptide/nickel transport system permease protein